MRVGIIGGGVAGLVAAYELAQHGIEATVLEKSAQLGGLAGSFPVEDGHQIEKYYHFICKPDSAYLGMIRELGLYSRLRWVTTQMGFFYQGTLHALGDPLSLLLFPHLSLREKLWFGRTTMRAAFRNANSWTKLEDVRAEEWLVAEYGERAYQMLYRPLINLKFREYSSQLSAAWMWARLHRLGNSRTLTQMERIGYLDGGTQVYVDALEKAIRDLGGHICLEAEVKEIIVEGGRAQGVSCSGDVLRFEQVISTIPIPALLPLLRDVQDPYFQSLFFLQYLDVDVMVLRLRHRLTPYFWTNISDGRMNLAGIIEYTNLNPCSHLNGDAIIYIPQYLPAEQQLCQMPDDQRLELYSSYLSIINPVFDSSWVKSYYAFRTRFAQPVCQVGFSRHIPAMQTPITGLWITDSYQLHPDDRAISNSTTLGRKAAMSVLAKRSNT